MRNTWTALSTADESPAAAPEFTVNLYGATPSSCCSQLNPSRNAQTPRLPHNLVKLPLKRQGMWRGGEGDVSHFPRLNLHFKLALQPEGSPVLLPLSLGSPRGCLLCAQFSSEETDYIRIFHLATSSHRTQPCSRQSSGKQEWPENVDISSFIIQKVRAETKYADSDAG